MNGRIPGFKYNPRTHSARFSLYVPNTGGKLRRTLTVDPPSRAEALVLWQAFRDEVGAVDPDPPQRAVAPQPAAADGVPTFRVFIAEHLEKICARLAPKTLATYQTIADSRPPRMPSIRAASCNGPAAAPPTSTKCRRSIAAGGTRTKASRWTRSAPNRRTGGARSRGRRWSGGEREWK